MSEQKPWAYEDNGVPVYRASSIGSCIRSLTCARLGESARGPGQALRAAMDASGGLEDEAIRRFKMEMASDAVIWQQKRVELMVEYITGETWHQPAIVRGHLDGMYQLDDSIIEVKCLGVDNFAKYQSGGLDAMGKLGEKYKWQAAVYGHATERKVRFVIGEKLNHSLQTMQHPHEPGDSLFGIGLLLVSPPIDPESLVPLADIHAKIRAIEEAAANDELPECDGGCTRSSPFAECHVFPPATELTDPEVIEKLARFQEIKSILGSVEKGTGLLGEKEDISEWLKDNVGVGEFFARDYTMTIEHTKAPERLDTKRLKKERPDVAEEYKTFGHPGMRLNVKGGQ